MKIFEKMKFVNIKRGKKMKKKKEIVQSSEVQRGGKVYNLGEKKITENEKR